jgi:hypothetical protein
MLLKVTSIGDVEDSGQQKRVAIVGDASGCMQLYARDDNQGQLL